MSTYSESITDAPVASDSNSTALRTHGNLSDAPVVADSPASQKNSYPSNSDSAAATDSNKTQRISYPANADSTALSDAPVHWVSYFENLSDATSATDVLQSLAIWLMSDGFRVQADLASSWIGTRTITDQATLSDDMWITLAVILRESVALSDNLNAFVQVLKVIADGLTAADSTISEAQLAGIIQDALSFVGELWAGANLTINETAVISSVLTALRTTSATIADLATVLETPDHGLTVALLVNDTVSFPDPPVGQVFNPSQMLNAVIEEQVQILVGWNATDGTWTGWTLNATNQAVSNYVGWDFNSFTSFRGQLLGASSSQGLCVLGGPADGAAAISASLQSAVTDFGNSFLKRVKMAYLGLNTDGTVFFKTLTDDNIERVYQLVPDAPGLHTERVQLARGVMSRYWSFKLEAVGVDFRIDAVSLLPVTLERRI